MAAAENQDYEIYRGENKSLQLVIKDPNGNLIDLTNKYFRYRVTDGPDSTTNYIEKDTADMSIVGLGIAQITFAHSETQTLAAQDYYHEARVGDSGDDEVVTTTGTWTLKESSTNNTAPMSS